MAFKNPLSFRGKVKAPCQFSGCCQRITFNALSLLNIWIFDYRTFQSNLRDKRLLGETKSQGYTHKV